ncbi:MAG TPA: UDP-2,3-diacylglucosamine diphosphatase LpxI [bacterium]|nr:UDP-2,3-diacylglucosamine diphosphatase LpxI [bacterium]
MGSSANKLGLLAGGGDLPLLIAASARAKGYEVEAFGFEGMMPPGLSEATSAFHEFPFCRLGDILARMEDRGVKKAVTIGSIAQMSVIGGMPRFDDLALEVWKRLPDRRVDTIMRALLELLFQRGIEVLKAVDFLEDRLAPPGAMTGREPNEKERDDISFGFNMAKAVGALDVGQTVVVKNRAVMAVEAVEGTDQAVLRGGDLAKGGAVVVKVAKPGQDLRFDVPVVGMQTLKNMQKAGASVLAVESGMVLMVEKEAMIAFADSAGIALVGVRGPGVAEDEA